MSCRSTRGCAGSRATAAADVVAGWPLWLLRFEAATVYAASGLSKLLDPDWFSGTVTWHRVVLVRDRVDASVLPSWAVDVLADRSFHTVAAKLIIATELFIAAGLWSRRTRYAAVWVAICFHVAIELSAEVQVFSFLADRRARDLGGAVDPRSRAGAGCGFGVAASARGAVCGLDWLARFRIEWRPGGGPVTVVDRDGTVVEGGWAVCLVLSRLPLTAWFALPCCCLPRRPPSRHARGGRRVGATARR